MKGRLQVNGVLYSILDGLSDSCLLLDDQWTVLFANQKARHLLALPKVLHRLNFAAALPDTRIIDLIRRAERKKDGIEKEFIINLGRPGTRPDERCLAVNVAALRFRKGGRPYVRIILRDRTERYATEQVRKDFVANASHELRTPLSIINGYLENLLDGVVDDPQMARKCLQTMRKHGDRIARIIEDMLTLSKFESAYDEIGPRDLRRNQFSISECVGDVLERLHPVIETKQAHISVDVEMAADYLAGDRFYWDQIFFNLIENALKENQPGIAIRIVGRRYGSVLKIQVIDNGVGIPAGDLPFIFKRFYRVAKDHSSQAIKGTGLGLSIVRRAVESHGGGVSVESTQGVATIFTIELPDVNSLPEEDGEMALSEPVATARLLTVNQEVPEMD